jgi:hypothetical protein
MTSASQSRRHTAHHPAHVVEAHEDEAHDAPAAPPQEAEHTLHLKAPHGTEEANYGKDRYRVDNDQLVEVPTPEAASGLLDRGGFTVEPAGKPPPSGDTVALEHPEGADSVSWGGQTYAAQGNQGIVVPVEGAVDLGWHGFVVKTAAAEQQPAGD